MKLPIVASEGAPAVHGDGSDGDLPSSRKVHVLSGELAVPQREIALGGGEPPLRVYDTSGPQGHDVNDGLPKLRTPWIQKRSARGDGNFSQMHYARKGEIP